MRQMPMDQMRTDAVPVAPVAGDTVTILMATLNGAATLPQQFDSLAAQTHRNWRLWVSDDGSVDATRDLVASRSWHHPLRLLHGPKNGAATNFLSMLCHPELPAGLVAFADQDDVWLPGKLSRAVQFLAGVPEGIPALYGAASILTNANLRPLPVRHIAKRAVRKPPDFANALVQNQFSGHTMVLNAAAVELARRAGVPDGVLYHDWWLYQLIAGAGGALLLDPQPTVLYRQHSRQILGARHGPRAAFLRATQLAGGHWGAAIWSHAQALHRRRMLLAPDAAALVSDLLHGFPPSGLPRARAFAAAGLNRTTVAQTAALRICAVFGRV
jgi:glycosyltransferase involved in cell wall biosynthesis